MQKFKLGPLQKMWIRRLKAHPERQISKILGRLNTPYSKPNDKDYRACCLGEYLICYTKLNKLPLPFVDSNITDGGKGDAVSSLLNSYSKLGLYSNNGSFINYSSQEINGISCQGLADANDNNVGWLEIASFIEKNPEIVFTKSV